MRRFTTEVTESTEVRTEKNFKNSSSVHASVSPVTSVVNPDPVFPRDNCG
jgi:hypothetical protein